MVSDTDNSYSPGIWSIFKGLLYPYNFVLFYVLKCRSCLQVCFIRMKQVNVIRLRQAHFCFFSQHLYSPKGDKTAYFTTVLNRYNLLLQSLLKENGVLCSFQSRAQGLETVGTVRFHIMGRKYI